VHMSRIPRADLHRVADELLGLSREERGRYGGIHPGRIDVIGGGALIVDVLAGELAARAGVTELVVSEHDILDGIARSIA
jgi:exopolyphosphatase/guanosine-5'-triphosphate,3'-diphosphate pyrophosphatase